MDVDGEGNPVTRYTHLHLRIQPLEDGLQVIGIAGLGDRLGMGLDVHAHLVFPGHVQQIVAPPITALAADDTGQSASYYPISVEEYTYGDFDELRIDWDSCGWR